jgi:hypothetical protein
MGDFMEGFSIPFEHLDDPATLERVRALVTKFAEFATAVSIPITELSSSLGPRGGEAFVTLAAEVPRLWPSGDVPPSVGVLMARIRQETE